MKGSVREEVVDAEDFLKERFVARARKRFAQLDADKRGGWRAGGRAETDTETECRMVGIG